MTPLVTCNATNPSSQSTSKTKPIKANTEPPGRNNSSSSAAAYPVPRSPHVGQSSYETGQFAVPTPGMAALCQGFPVDGFGGVDSCQRRINVDWLATRHHVPI